MMGTMGTAGLTIESSMLKERLDTKAPLLERLKEAMRLVGTREVGMGWAVSDEDQFKVAVGAVLLTSSPEEREEISGQLRKMRQAAATIEALQAGVPVDVEKLAAEAKNEPEPPFHLRVLWEEARKERREKERREREAIREAIR